MKAAGRWGGGGAGGGGLLSQVDGLTTGAADKALGVVEAVQGLAGIALPVDPFVTLDTGA